MQSSVSRYKRPESVLVVVYTRAGEVLMLRRTLPKFFWQSVTGSLKWGESPRRAAARELYEETGLRPDKALVDWRHRERFPIRGVWRKRYAPSVRFNHEHWFGLLLPRRRRIRLNAAEHGEYRWLPVVRAVRLSASWTNRKAIETLARGRFFSNAPTRSANPRSRTDSPSRGWRHPWRAPPIGCEKRRWRIPAGGGG